MNTHYKYSFIGPIFFVSNTQTKFAMFRNLIFTILKVKLFCKYSNQTFNYVELCQWNTVENVGTIENKIDNNIFFKWQHLICQTDLFFFFFNCVAMFSILCTNRFVLKWVQVWIYLCFLSMKTREKTAFSRLTD